MSSARIGNRTYNAVIAILPGGGKAPGELVTNSDPAVLGLYMGLFARACDGQEASFLPCLDKRKFGFYAYDKTGHRGALCCEPWFINIEEGQPEPEPVLLTPPNDKENLLLEGREIAALFVASAFKESWNDTATVTVGNHTHTIRVVAYRVAGVTHFIYVVRHPQTDELEAAKWLINFGVKANARKVGALQSRFFEGLKPHISK